MYSIDYVRETNKVLNSIRIIRYIRSFRADKLVNKYRHIRACLTFRQAGAVSNIRAGRSERHRLRKLGLYNNKEFKPSTDYTRQQFDSCSYQELTYCVVSRLSNIREYRDFLNNKKVTEKYSVMKSYVEHSLERSQKEVRRLLKMRRVLKKSQYKNWDSRLLKVDMEECKDFDFYNENMQNLINLVIGTMRLNRR